MKFVACYGFLAFRCQPLFYFVLCYLQASYRVHEVCASDIKKYGCIQHVKVGVNDGTDMVGLSGVLLCLENVKIASSMCLSMIILNVILIN